MNYYKLIKFKDNEFELDVNVSPEEDTVWLTKDEIALFFERDRTVISKHINNIYKEGELDEHSTCAKNAQVQLEGKRKIVRTNTFHDRYLIIDNSTCYSLGTSLNYMGKRVFAVNNITEKEIIDLIIKKLEK